MCYRVDCNKCGKYSWGGCGKHLTTLSASIEKGKHCLCRPWPGVSIPSDDSVATTNPSNSATSTITTSGEK
ncbi:hypothetical protein LguiA_017402 [Lonicera macranthoides]